MSKLIKTNVEGFYKSHNAIVNNDTKALQAYKLRRQLFRDQAISKDRLKKLENDVKDIKEMFKIIMEKLH